jgi:hypothetical protein
MIRMRILAPALSALLLPASTVAQTPTVSSVSPNAALAQAAVNDAAKRLAKAQSKLAKANKAIAASTNKQASAATAATGAAAEYRQLTAAVPDVTTSAEAVAWGDRVAGAAHRWAKADKSGAKGGEKLSKATNAKQAAEAEIVAAQAALDRARAGAR